MFLTTSLILWSLLGMDGAGRGWTTGSLAMVGAAWLMGSLDPAGAAWLMGFLAAAEEAWLMGSLATAGAWVSSGVSRRPLLFSSTSSAQELAGGLANLGLLKAFS